MILFAEDWLKYPDAIPDIKTPNRSYLRLAKMLQQMKVQNCVFHLALLQPELQGVDPFDPHLTIEQVVMIKEESVNNPWYFFREVIRLPPASGEDPVFFEVNRGALAAWWCYLNHQDYNLTMPRQTGKSTSTNVLLVWLLFVVYRKTRIFLLTKDNTLRTENVEQIKKIQDLLPAYMNPKTRDDLSNTQTITCAKYGNRLFTGVPQNSEADANKMGRGLTCATYVTDEGPFIKYLEKSLRSMLAGGTKAMPMAAKNGLPYGAIYTTTAGSKADDDGRYYYRMIMGGCPWDESYFDLSDEHEFRATIKRNRNGGVQSIVNITMSHLQLGYDDEWLKAAIERTGVTGDDANKDFFNVWSDGSMESPLSKVLSNLIRASECNPDYIEFTKDNYAINWYIPEHEIERRMAAGKYIIGLDPSPVIGKDGLGFFMIDSKTMETICTLSVNETNILKFVQWLCGFMIKYENTIIIPERRGGGETIIAGLLIEFTAKKIDPFKRIYNTVVDKGEHHNPEGKRMISEVRNRAEAADRSVRYFGFATSGSGVHSREGLYDMLTRAASYSGPILKDKKTISEVLSLSKKRGRIDHSVLGHDDCVIAWLLTVWMLTNARNLDYYGIYSPMFEAIDHSTRMRHSEMTNDKIVAHDIFAKAAEQKRIKKQIDEYLDLIKNTSDEILSLRYEAALTRLDRLYIREDTEVRSIAELIKQAKEEKRNKNNKYGGIKKTG